MKKNLYRKTFSVDKLMRNTALSLIRDFQDNLNDPTFCSSYQNALRRDMISEARKITPAADSSMDLPHFKATYQVESVLKRYRFRKDTYSDKELTEKAIESFRETQSRLADQDLKSLPAFTQRVLDLAAGYVSKVLGPYSDEEHRDLCRFGRKASVGVPARQACLAARWEIPITGSREQISWFDLEISQDWMVQEYLTRQKDSDPSRSVYRETDSLNLTLVPKSFKSLRSIMPNTTIGSYMSYGLGEMLRKRLKRIGYDIKSLQQRHRYLARSASLHGLHVTADLSSASDSISVQLVERLFPSDWFDILNKSRIANVTLPDGSCIESKTFCTMGIGYTFPLQTLVFLSLLFAIQAITYHRLDRRLISVYGDDMIYSSRMHHLVVEQLTLIGFVINIEKTYHDGNFRESCGGDYYHGVDVRPFQPRNGSAVVGKRTYEAILYKFINGLLMRWDEYEIGHTLNYLTSEVESIVNKAKIVPIDFPDDAGIKCSVASVYAFLNRSKCSFPKHIGHGVYRFSYLRLVPELRKELRHDPYYWGKLRGGPLHANTYWLHDPQRDSYTLRSLIDTVTGVQDEETYLLTKEDRPIRTFRSRITKVRYRRTSTFVTISHTGGYSRQTGFSCFENRR